MTDSTRGRRRSTRRILTLALGGALIAAAMSVAPAAAAPTAGPSRSVEAPAAAAPRVDVVTLTSTDMGGYETKMGTVRLTSYMNAGQTAFSKQTLRFAIPRAQPLAVFYVRIFQGTCADSDRTFVVKIKVKANASGRLPQTVAFSSAQRAKMWQIAHEYPAVSMFLWPDEPSTGASYPCGQIWGEGL